MTDQLFTWLSILILTLFADWMLFRWSRYRWQHQALPLSSMVAQVWRQVAGRLGQRGRPQPAVTHTMSVPSTTTSEVPDPTPEPAPASSEADGPVVEPPAASGNGELTDLVKVNLTPTPDPAAPPPPPQTARVNITVDLPPGARVRLTVESLAEGFTVTTDPPEVISKAAVHPSAKPQSYFVAPPLPAQLQTALAPLAQLGDRLRARWRAGDITLEVTLFGLALAVYVITRLIGLEDFPVYFFTDEAIHTNMAADFIQRGLRNYEGDFLPVYFNLGLWLNGISVYVQVLPYLLFGKSIFVTRAASALVTALGAAAVGLTLKDVFKAKYWWAGALLLSIAPTWFFHSRTAFEYIELASFYAVFIYCYLRYRTGALPFLYAAVVAGALVFYTHGLGQMLIGVTAVALFISDVRYHAQHRATVLRAFGLALLLALPYLRYILAHADTYFINLRQRDSYWTDLNLALPDKLGRFVSEYFYGLSPQFWFLPNNRDLQRHVMKGYGHLLLPTLPFAALGLLLVLRNIRSATHRALLIALLCTPIGSALIAIGVPRMLWFVVPATLITGLGLNVSLEWLQRWLQREPSRGFSVAASVALFAVLAGTNLYMLNDGLRNGPRWYTDYTLYGMQYGAKQVFGELVPSLLARDPQAEVYVSPSWANGTEQFLPFFFEDPQQMARVRIRTVDEFLFQRTDLRPSSFFVMMPAEYDAAVKSAKFKPISLDTTLFYPDGSIAFYVARLEYADNVDAIFAAEAAERRKPVEGQIVIDGQLVAARYSRLGSGDLIHMFDGDTFTLVRGLEANPFVIELTFPEPRSVSALAADFGSMDFALTVLLYPTGSETPVPYTQNFTQNKPDPHVDLTFTDGPAQVSSLRLEVRHLNAGDTAQIHIRELKFLP